MTLCFCAVLWGDVELARSRWKVGKDDCNNLASQTWCISTFLLPADAHCLLSSCWLLFLTARLPNYPASGRSHPPSTVRTFSNIIDAWLKNVHGQRNNVSFITVPNLNSSDSSLAAFFIVIIDHTSCTSFLHGFQLLVDFYMSISSRDICISCCLSR